MQTQMKMQMKTEQKIKMQMKTEQKIKMQIKIKIKTKNAKQNVNDDRKTQMQMQIEIKVAEPARIPQKNPIEPPLFEEYEHGDTFLVHNKEYVILDLQ